MPAHDETEVLREAIAATDDWLERLPPDSRWHRPFLVVRREVSKALGLRHLRPLACADSRSETKDSDNQALAELRKHEAVWNGLPPWERERRVLGALADDELTRAEVAERAIGHSVYQSRVDHVLARLMRSGDVQRAQIAGYRGGPYPRWRYARNTALTGPIAGLERAFHEPQDALGDG